MKREVLIFLKKIYNFIWRQYYTSQSNEHLNGDNIKKVKIPFNKNSVYVRPTKSDGYRVSEFVEEIYFSRTYLHERLKLSEPSVIIDLGANIGLSTLSFIDEFPSLTRAVAVEADDHNFSVLAKNFDLWREAFPNVNFKEIKSIASASADDIFEKSPSLLQLTQNSGYSSSGTQRFQKKRNSLQGKVERLPVLPVKEIIKNISEDSLVMVKVDIEGGEEYLFEKNFDWLQKVAYLTIETHDQFSETTINSSKNLLKAISQFNFALVPSHNTLHFYNRRLI